MQMFCCCAVLIPMQLRCVILLEHTSGLQISQSVANIATCAAIAARLYWLLSCTITISSPLGLARRLETWSIPLYMGIFDQAVSCFCCSLTGSVGRRSRLSLVESLSGIVLLYLCGIPWHCALNISHLHLALCQWSIKASWSKSSNLK